MKHTGLKIVLFKRAVSIELDAVKFDGLWQNKYFPIMAEFSFAPPKLFMCTLSKLCIFVLQVVSDKIQVFILLVYEKYQNTTIYLINKKKYNTILHLTF